MAEERTINWASAEVKNGTLTVALSSPAAKPWSERFDGVLRLLVQSNGGWGEVSLSKKAVRVTGVQPGAEDDLHHFLESVVMQVNSELRVEDPVPEPGDPDDAEDRQ